MSVPTAVSWDIPYNVETSLNWSSCRNNCILKRKWRACLPTVLIWIALIFCHCEFPFAVLHFTSLIKNIQENQYRNIQLFLTAIHIWAVLYKICITLLETGIGQSWLGFQAQGWSSQTDHCVTHVEALYVNDSSKAFCIIFHMIASSISAYDCC